MHITDSKQLLNWLDQQINSKSKKSLDDQIQRLFAPKLWGNGVVLPESLHGRISQFLNKKIEARHEKAIKQMCTDAFIALKKDKEAFNAISPSLRLRLHHYLRAELKNPDPALNLPVNDQPEVDELYSRQTEINEERKRALHQLSLLRDRFHGDEEMDLAAFEKIFAPYDTKDLKFLDDLVIGIKNHSNCAIPTIDEVVPRLRQAQREQEDLMGQLPPVDSSMDEVFLQWINDKAAELENRIRGSEASMPWILKGSYGNKVTSLKGVGNLLKSLPDSITATFPPAIKDFLVQEELPDPIQFVQGQFEEYFNELSKPLSSFGKSLNISGIHVLLENQGKLPETLQENLPKNVVDNMESWIQQGLIGNYAEFLDDGLYRELLLNTSKYGSQIRSKEGCNQLIQSIKAKVIETCTQPAYAVSNLIDSGIEELISQIQKIIPPSLHELIGLDQIFSFGPLWFEFVRQEDGRFTVLIYSLGSSLNYFQGSPDNVEWPMRLKNVGENQLNKKFFQRILYYTFAPQRDQKFTAQPKDIFENIIGMLQGERGASEFRNLSRTSPTEFDLVEKLLTKSTASANYRFNRQVEALVAFCRPYLSSPGSTLQFNDDQTVQALKKALKEIKEGCQKHQHLISEEKRQRIEATETEIEQAIEAYEKTKWVKPVELAPTPFQFPPLLQSKVRAIFHRNGIDLRQIQSVKSSLCWALGDEVGQLIDALVESVDALPPAADSDIQVQPLDARVAERGWLRTIILNTYFKLAVKAFEMAIALSTASKKGYKYLLIPALRYSIHNIFPTKIRDWYLQILSLIVQKMSDFVLRMILNCLLSKEDATLLTNLSKSYQRTIGNFSNAILGKQTLNYQIENISSSSQETELFKLDPKPYKVDLRSKVINQKFHTFLNFKIHSNPVLIRQHELADLLTSWINEAKKIQPIQMREIYLNKQIRLLEIPAFDEITVWDSVEDPAAMMEVVYELGLSLTVLRSHFRTNSNYGLFAEHAESVITMYTLLAIMDRLARKCPQTHLQGYRVNGYRLLSWVKDAISQMDDPALFSRLKKVCGYLTPEMDLLNLPETEELYKRERLTLFNYLDFPNFNREIPEINYLLDRLKEPEVKNKLKQTFNLPADASEIEGFSILFNASFPNTLGEKAPLSRPYSLLRMQNLIANETVNGWSVQTSPFISQELDQLSRKKYKKDLSNESIIDTLTRAWNDFQKNWEPNIPRFLNDNFYHFGFGYLQNLLLGLELFQAFRSRTQTKIMNKPIHDRDIINTEESDSIIRLLAFYRNEKKKFSKDDELRFFEYHLFRNGFLEKQLMESPQVARVIGEVMSELLDHFILEKKHGLISYFIFTTHRLKEYCKQVAPQYCDKFPDLKKLIQSKKKSVDLIEQLEAIILESDNDHLTEGLILYCAQLFKHSFYPIKLGKKDHLFPAEGGILPYENHNNPIELTKLSFKDIFHRQIFRKFAHRFLELSSSIQLALRNPLTQIQLLRGILLSNGIVIEEENPVFEEINTWVYRLGDFTLDFEKGTIKSDQIDDHKKVFGVIKDQFHAIFTGNPEIHRISDEIFESKDKQFQIRLKGDEITATRMINGKRYRDITPLEESFSPLFLRLTKFHTYYHGGIWLEETNSSQKQMYLFNERELKGSFTVEQIANQFHIIAQHDDNGSLSYVSSEEVADYLAPLKRFCCFSKVSFWKNAESQQIKKITFEPYALSFDVDLVEGQPAAFNTHLFPGYIIAPQQNDPDLSDFVSYLLLTHHSNQRKVLIPTDKWFSSAIWRGASKLGSFSNLTAQWLSSISESNEIEITRTMELSHKNNYWEYSLDEEGNLSSEEPGALAYLLSLYLIHGNMEKALKVFEDLELLCKRVPIALDLQKILIPLGFVRNVFPEVTLIRQRLMAVLEENLLIHAPTLKKTKQASKIQEDLALVLLIYLDLEDIQKKKDPRYQLRDDQEWFLFKCYFRHLKNLIPGRVEQDKKFAFFSRELGLENVLAMLGLSTPLRQRFEELSKKYGEKDSKLIKAAIFAKDVVMASSAIPIPDRFNVIPFNYNTTLQHASNLARNYVRYENNLNMLDLLKLKKTMGKNRTVNARLDFENMTDKMFIHHFLDYYAMAKGDEGSTAQSKLGMQLTIFSGGWNFQTSLLISYLKAVVHSPILFPTSRYLEDLLKEEILEKENANSKRIMRLNPLKVIPKFSRFFKTLNDRMLAIDSLKIGLSAISQWTAEAYMSNQLLKAIPLVNRIPMPAMMLKGIRWSGKVYAALTQNKPLTTISRAPQIVEENSSYAYLETEDTAFDILFDHLFDLTFTKESQKSVVDDVHFEPFVIKDSYDRSTKENMTQANNSIKAFYEKKDRLQPAITFKGGEALFDLHLNLKSCRDQLEEQLDAEFKRLQDFGINKLPGKEPLSFNDMKRVFLTGDITVLKFFGFSADLTQQLEYAFARWVLRKTRLQQMDRALQLLEKLSELDPAKDKTEYKEKIEKLADVLQARRVYSFAENSLKLLRRAMIFELIFDVMLWDKQYHKTKNRLLGPDENAVLQMLMTEGKTFYTLPTDASYIADGQRLVVSITPVEMHQTNVHQLSFQGKKAYDQIVNILTFRRDIKLTEENYKAINVLLQRAITNRESINMVKESAQALQCIFIENLDRLSQQAQQKQIDLNLERVVELQRKILHTFRTQAKNVADEGHVLLQNRDELNHPYGDSLQINPLYYDVIENCISIFIEREEALSVLRSLDFDLFYQNNDVNFEAKIKPFIAEKMADYPRFNIKTLEKKAEFIAYVTDASKAPPKWICDNFAIKEEIDLVRGMLNDILPEILKDVVHVNYGLSKRNKTMRNGPDKVNFAVPFLGNTKAKERSRIYDPAVALVKTFTTYLNNTLDLEEVKALTNYLYHSAETTAKENGIPFSETKAAQTFTRLIATSSLSKTPVLLNATNHLITNKDWESIFKALKSHKEAALLYVRHMVRKNIRYSQYNIRSNARNYDSMFESSFYQTGTPYNDKVYPARLKMLWDEEAMGEALHILSTKCPPNGIHVYQSTTPLEILKEVLKNFFWPGSDFTALIDEAQLTGMEGVEVVKVMLEHVETHRPDIQAIDFFMPDEEGNDQLYSWQVGADNPVLYTQSRIPLEARLAYFDHCHCFAADIPQKSKGKGLFLLKKKQEAYRLLQGAFRMRLLKVFLKMLGLDENIKNIEDLKKWSLKDTQTIHFAISCESQEMINGPNAPADKIPTFREIAEYAFKNQNLTRDNYNSYLQGIDDIIRYSVLDKIYATHNIRNIFSLFREFRKVFISKLEDNPSKLYGMIKDEISAEDALELARDNAYGLVKDSWHFSDEEKKKISKELNALPKGIMPEKVPCYKNAEGVPQLHLLDDLVREVHQVQDQDQKLDQRQEKELHQELSQQTQHQTQTKRFTEWTWSNKITSRSLAWIKFDSVVKNIFQIQFKDLFQSGVGVPLFRVCDLLENSTPSLRNVSKAFDSRLWFSNNFLPTSVEPIIEQRIEIGTYFQRELYQVLIHFDSSIHDQPIQSVGCLSQKDAAFWRKKLWNTGGGNSKIKVFLYDVQLRTIVAGDAIDLSELTKNADFLKLECMLKFLNGDVKYHPSQVPFLREWILKNTDEKMKVAFFEIISHRGKSPHLGSQVDLILNG